MSSIPSSQNPPDILGFQAGRNVEAALYGAEIDAANFLFARDGWRMAGIFPAWDDDGGPVYGVTTSATYTQNSSRVLSGEMAPWDLHRWGGVLRYSRVDRDDSTGDIAVNFWFGAVMQNMDLRITITDLDGLTLGTPLVISRSTQGFASGVYAVSLSAVSAFGAWANGPRWDMVVKAEWKTKSGTGTGYLNLGPFGRTLILVPGQEGKIPRFDCSEWIPS